MLTDTDFCVIQTASHIQRGARGGGGGEESLELPI